MIGHYRTNGFSLGVAMLAACLLLAGSAVRGETPLRIFVSTQGNDAWSGRLEVPNAARSDGPFATLRHARDAVRTMRKEAKNAPAVTILVRAGSYELGETLRFLPEDGGSASAPVVYQAYPGERPILRGGRRITGFVPHHGQIQKAELAAQGLKGVTFKELFCAGQRLPLARYPNIHDGPRMGIMFSSNNLVIEYNHVRHMNLETEDTGAVYTGGRDWMSSRGTVIRYNLFHDMLGFGKDEQGRWISPHFAWGVYLDDNTGGVDVVGNIVFRCSRAGLHLHNGRDNHIWNNIFVDNGPRQYEYSGWTRNHSYWKDHLPTMIQGYERVASSPAWKTMRNMNIHPRDAVLPDGLIMTGNEFTRNIIAYRDPDAALVRTNDVPFDHNVADFNLVWHHGMPVKTGQHQPGKNLSGNLAPNGDFSRGALGGLPGEWEWQIKPPAAAAALVEESGQRALKIEAALDATRPRDNYPIVVSREFPARPGHAYRIKARIKASHPETKANLMLQGYEANVYFWANWPSELKVGTDWNDHEFVFRIPGPGERGHHPRMGSFRARVDFPDPSGSLLVSEVSLHEIEMQDEWASWQALGMDRHSRIADPKFVDADHQDFRLEPDSPAFALGSSRSRSRRSAPTRTSCGQAGPSSKPPAHVSTRSVRLDETRARQFPLWVREAGRCILLEC